MTFLVSPGVNVTETDLSNYVANVSTSVGAIVGAFAWGPLNEIMTFGTEKALVDRVQKPDANSYIHFHCAANFLAYAASLRVIRVTAEGTAKNAVVSGSAIIIKNRDHYENSFSTGQAAVGIWAAKYCGTLGNSLKVSMCPSASAFSQALTGTNDVTGTAMVGTGTAYTTELAVGSVVYNVAGTESRTVTAIADATHATLSAAFTVDIDDGTLTAKWEYHDQFGVAPGSSTFATARGGSADEMHIIVLDEDGAFTGIPGTILEKYYFVSKASDAKNPDGTSNFYKDVINTQSKYIWWMDKLTTGTNWDTSAVGTAYTNVKKAETASLVSGVDGNASVADADLQRGWAIFANNGSVEIAFCIGANANAVTANWIIDNVCEIRKDCVGFFSPPQASVVNNAGSEVSSSITFRNTLRSTSYGVLDSGWKKQYDRYNDTDRWIPINGDTAGLCARTDFTNDPWWSPAGYQRGRIKNLKLLAFNPGQADRDDLYLANINPVVIQDGQGPVLFGDKTMLTRPSAFDRINVRRLFIVLEKAIANATKYLLFEFNDAQTRLLFKQLVEPFLRDVKSRRGVYDYLVICDETNNTPETIDRNELVGDIFIKPTKSINFIQLNFIATKTGANFQEIINANR